MNGELVTVRDVRSDGTIELEDGRVLDNNYREFVHATRSPPTVHRARMWTTCCSQTRRSKAATNDQQWYVTISRGRKGIRIFTPDKAQLRENVIRSGQRKLALELTGQRYFNPVPRFGWFKRMEARLHRFGRRAARHIIRARRFARSIHKPTLNVMSNNHSTAITLTRKPSACACRPRRATRCCFRFKNWSLPNFSSPTRKRTLTMHFDTHEVCRARKRTAANRECASTPGIVQRGCSLGDTP